jgi:hypothetical protein
MKAERVEPKRHLRARGGEHEYPQDAMRCSLALTRAGLRERPLFSAGRQSRRDELFFDLLVDCLKPTFGAGRALSEQLDLAL